MKEPKPQETTLKETWDRAFSPQEGYDWKSEVRKQMWEHEILNFAVGRNSELQDDLLAILHPIISQERLLAAEEERERVAREIGEKVEKMEAFSIVIGGRDRDGVTKDKVLEIINSFTKETK